ASPKGKPSKMFLVVGALLVLGGLLLGIWALSSDASKPEPNKNPTLNVNVPVKTNAGGASKKASGTKVHVFDSQQRPIADAEVLADGISYPVNAEGFALVAEEAETMVVSA